MLYKHLTAIKGELFNHFSQVYIDMNTTISKENGKVEIDFETLGEEVERCITDIFKIQSVDQLDNFCEDWGLNDLEIDFPLSFYNLAKKYLAEKLPD